MGNAQDKDKEQQQPQQDGPPEEDQEMEVDDGNASDEAEDNADGTPDDNTETDTSHAPVLEKEKQQQPQQDGPTEEDQEMEVSDDGVEAEDNIDDKPNANKETETPTPPPQKSNDDANDARIEADDGQAAVKEMDEDSPPDQDENANGGDAEENSGADGKSPEVKGSGDSGSDGKGGQNQEKEKEQQQQQQQQQHQYRTLFGSLILFFEEHGHTEVPTNHQLYPWVVEQRAKFDKLPGDMVKQLQMINFRVSNDQKPEDDNIMPIPKRCAHKGDEPCKRYAAINGFCHVHHLQSNQFHSLLGINHQHQTKIAPSDPEVRSTPTNNTSCSKSKKVQLWRCDKCQKVAFESFAKAVRHEETCQGDKERGGEIQEVDTKGGKEQNQGDSNTADNHDMHGATNAAESPLSTTTNTINKSAKKRKRTLWQCDICKQAAFVRYDECVAHEKKCELLAKNKVMERHKEKIKNAIQQNIPGAHNMQQNIPGAHTMYPPMYYYMMGSSWQCQYPQCQRPALNNGILCQHHTFMSMANSQYHTLGTLGHSQQVCARDGCSAVAAPVGPFCFEHAALPIPWSTINPKRRGRPQETDHHQKAWYLWTEAEDRIIINAVKNSGKSTKWDYLAKMLLPGRQSDQIRARWTNHLNPAINHEPFSKEDDLCLWQGHKNFGRSWTQISATCFNGTRPGNHLSNRWCSVDFRMSILDEFGPDAYRIEHEAGYTRSKLTLPSTKQEKTRQDEEPLPLNDTDTSPDVKKSNNEEATGSWDSTKKEEDTLNKKESSAGMEIKMPDDKPKGSGNSAKDSGSIETKANEPNTAVTAKSDEIKNKDSADAKKNIDSEAQLKKKDYNNYSQIETRAQLGFEESASIDIKNGTAVKGGQAHILSSRRGRRMASSIKSNLESRVLRLYQASFSNSPHGASQRVPSESELQINTEQGGQTKPRSDIESMNEEEDDHASSEEGLPLPLFQQPRT